MLPEPSASRFKAHELEADAKHVSPTEVRLAKVAPDITEMIVTTGQQLRSEVVKIGQRMDSAEASIHSAVASIHSAVASIHSAEASIHGAMEELGRRLTAVQAEVSHDRETLKGCLRDVLQNVGGDVQNFAQNFGQQLIVGLTSGLEGLGRNIQSAGLPSHRSDRSAATPSGTRPPPDGTQPTTATSAASPTTVTAATAAPSGVLGGARRGYTGQRTPPPRPYPRRSRSPTVSSPRPLISFKPNGRSYNGSKRSMFRHVPDTMESLAKEWFEGGYPTGAPRVIDLDKQWGARWIPKENKAEKKYFYRRRKVIARMKLYHSRESVRAQVEKEPRVGWWGPAATCMELEQERLGFTSISAMSDCLNKDGQFTVNFMTEREAQGGEMPEDLRFA